MKLLIQIFAIFICLFSHAYAGEYDKYFSEKTSWETNALDLVNSLDATKSVTWLGKVIETRYFTNKDNVTSIEWLCEQYEFSNPSPNALKEPFSVKKTPKGYFVMSLALPTLTTEQAKEKMAELKTPSWILISGNGELVQNYNEKYKAVYLHADKSIISDEFKVSFVD